MDGTMPDAICCLSDCIEQLQSAEQEISRTLDSLDHRQDASIRSVLEAAAKLQSLMQDAQASSLDAITRHYKQHRNSLAKLKASLNEEYKRCREVAGPGRRTSCSEEEALALAHSAQLAVEEALSVSQAISEEHQLLHAMPLRISENAASVVKNLLQLPSIFSKSENENKKRTCATSTADRNNTAASDDNRTGRVDPNRASENLRELDCGLDKGAFTKLVQDKTREQNCTEASVVHLSSNYFTEAKFSGVSNEGNKSQSTVDAPDMNRISNHEANDAVDTSSLSFQPLAVSKKSPIPLKSERAAVVTTVFSPSLFYYRTSAHNHHFKRLSSSLNSIAPSATPVRQPVLGEMYLSRSLSDNVWYRAEVTGLPGDLRPLNFVLVLYLDFGGTEELPLNRLRMCPSQYKKLPWLAERCCLAGVLPASSAGSAEEKVNVESDALNDPHQHNERLKSEDAASSTGPDWSDEAFHVFCQLVLDATVQIFVFGVEHYMEGSIRRSKLQVDVWRVISASGVYAKPSLSVRQVMLQLGLACPHPDVSKLLVDERSKSSQPVRQYFKQEVMTYTDAHVFLTNFDSPHHFHVILDGPSNSEQLERLHGGLQSLYSSHTSSADWLVFQPDVGTPCVARSSKNGLWFRALVEEVHPVLQPGDLYVSVIYVDSGCRERLRYTQLCKIKDTFMKLPAQAIACRLANIEPLQAVGPDDDTADPAFWNAAAKELADSYIETLNEKGSFTATFHRMDERGARVVSLCIRTGPESIFDLSDHFVQLGYARLEFSEREESQNAVLGLDGQVVSHFNCYPSGVRRFSKLRGRRAVISPKMRPDIVAETTCEPPTIGSRSAVNVVYLGLISPSAIFLRLEFHSPHLYRLQIELDSAFENAQEEGDVSISVGKLYVAVLKEQPYLARAKVLQSEPEDSVKVLLVDCGNVLSVPVSTLRSLPSNLASIKPMAFLASLYDIAPPGGHKTWPYTTVDALKDILSSVSSLYLLKQGNSWRCEKLYGLKVVPATLGYTATVTSPYNFEPFSSEDSTHRISVSQQLVQAGLALPLRAIKKIDAASYDQGKTDSATDDVSSSSTVHVSSNIKCDAAKSPEQCSIILPDSAASKEDECNESSISIGSVPYPADNVNHKNSKGLIQNQVNETCDSSSNVKSLTRSNDLVESMEKICSERVETNDTINSKIPAAQTKTTFSFSSLFSKSKLFVRDKSNSSKSEEAFTLLKNSEDRKKGMGSLHEKVSCSSVKDGAYDKIPAPLLDVNKPFQTTSNVTNNEMERRVKWLPNTERLSGSFSAIPTYVDDFGRIHLHTMSSEHSLKLLRHSLLLEFRHSSPEMTSVRESNLQFGEDVIALFRCDNTWHRATVVQILSDEEVRVMFVDFGNEEFVPVKHLRRTQRYGDLPVQRHVVSLADVEPDNPVGKWESTVLHCLHVNIVSKVCRVTVVPSSPKDEVDDILQVNLVVERSNLNVNKWLVEGLKKCRWALSASISGVRCGNRNKGRLAVAGVCDPTLLLSARRNLAESSQASEVEDVQPRQDAQEAPTRVTSLPPLPLPPCGVFFPARVSSIVGPDFMYVSMNFCDLDKPSQELGGEDHVNTVLSRGPAPHECSGNTKCVVCVQFEQAVQQKHFLLQKLMHCVQLNAMALPTLAHPAPGHICLAYVSYCEKWQRCQLLDALSRDELRPEELLDHGLSDEHQELYRVFLLDFGSDSIVPVSLLRELPPPLSDICGQTFSAKLHGIANASPGQPWNYETMEQMIMSVMPDHLQVFYAVIRSKHCDRPPEVELYSSPSGRFDSGDLRLVYQPLIDRGLLTYQPSY